MFEAKIVRNCSKCKGCGRVSGVLNNRRVKCPICDGRGSMEVTLIVNASTSKEAAELLRTDGYRTGVFNRFEGDEILSIKRLERNIYLVA